MGRTLSRARTATAVALGVLCGGQMAAGTAHADGDGTHAPAYGLSVLTIDNSGADSWLEVDRTLNILAPLSKGTAGSDHDGGGGAIDQVVSGSSGVGLQAAPQEHGDGNAGDGDGDGDTTSAGDGDKAGGGVDSAACGGDDPEGDADHDPARDARRQPGSCDGPSGAANGPRKAQP